MVPGNKMCAIFGFCDIRGFAVINEVLWRSVDTDTWVTFKAFGIPLIVLIFSLFMSPVLRKHQLKQDD